jgi:hypothetical protein
MTNWTIGCNRAAQALVQVCAKLGYDCIFTGEMAGHLYGVAKAPHVCIFPEISPLLTGKFCIVS